ncbi:MAG: hypothetical protein ACR2IV_24085 [Bryobacteraceae bacterium]
MRLLSFIVIPLSIVIALGATLAGRSGEDQVRTLAEDFVHGSLALTPTIATAQGYRLHHGIRLDELLEDYSQGGIGRARAFYQQSLADVNRSRGGQLTPEMNADLDVIGLQCEWSPSGFRHDPGLPPQPGILRRDDWKRCL